MLHEETKSVNVHEIANSRKSISTIPKYEQRSMTSSKQPSSSFVTSSDARSKNLCEPRSQNKDSNQSESVTISISQTTSKKAGTIKINAPTNTQSIKTTFSVLNSDDLDQFRVVSDAKFQVKRSFKKDHINKANFLELQSQSQETGDLREENLVKQEKLRQGTVSNRDNFSLDLDCLAEKLGFPANHAMSDHYSQVEFDSFQKDSERISKTVAEIYANCTKAH